jgi:hypothetical protein
MKSCNRKAILNVIKKADYVAHTISGTLSVEHSKKFAVHHHLYAAISEHYQHYQTNALSIPANTPTKPKTTNIYLANNRCIKRINCIIPVMRIRNLPSEKAGHLEVPRKCSGAPGHFFKKWDSLAEKREKGEP